MEPSKEAIAVRLARLNRLILGKATGVNSNLKKTVDREALLDALTVLYDECNDDPVKKVDDIVRAFIDKYRSTVAELRQTRVCLADFNVLQTIGRGHFGEVHLVREKETSDVYALKTLRKEHAYRRGAACIEEERDILALGNGPWFPKLQYAFQDNSSLYIVMELCSGGDLSGLLSRRNHPLCERDAAFYVAEVAHALRALHTLGYVHRDVKPENILLDRCGHVKLGDFGSCTRMSGGCGGAVPVATADYMAPELLAAADCGAKHQACLASCQGVHTPHALSACDYWSLGVVAFELVTLRRPFSDGDNDSVPKILSNIQKYERAENPTPPFDPPPSGPSAPWRSLVSGLLRAAPAERYHYLDTLQHGALRHLDPLHVRDQAPPWVPSLRGPEDSSYFAPVPKQKHSPQTGSFRTRAPFAGQLPFIGFSYVAPDNEESSVGFNASSHDCTAIDLATFKSAEKLAAMRAREIANLQAQVSEASANAASEAERARRAAEDEAERVRAKLQAEITALTLQNKRLERQIEIEKEDRMSLERSNQEASISKERHMSELRRAQTQASELESQRNVLKEDVRRMERRVAELKDECQRAMAAAGEANEKQKHYKAILEQAKDLRHRRLTEINVRAIDTMAKERALRRQTVTELSSETRESSAKLAAAAAAAANEQRAREEADMKLATTEHALRQAQAELDQVRSELGRVKESISDSSRTAKASSEELRQVQLQLTQERVRSATLQAQVQDLQNSLQEASSRETALEEQFTRSEARLRQQLEASESRAATSAREHSRHRDKVQQLEQLVRQLEREVNVLEARNDGHGKKETASDTESVGENETAVHGQVALLKEQLERAEASLQARADEIAALKLEARTANLARWRKEREYNDLEIESKATARDLKRLEERLAIATEARRTAEHRVTELQTEMAELKPRSERDSEELAKVKEELEKITKTNEVLQAEVDRSRNDILKLKSELQYSERRRIRAEQQEEASNKERARLSEDVHALRTHNCTLEQNNKALQEACTLLEDQLTDLEKLADMHELKNKDLEAETIRMRSELSQLRDKLSRSEREISERSATMTLTEQLREESRAQARALQGQLDELQDRLESREERINELETALAQESAARATLESRLAASAKREAILHEEAADSRTRAAQYHAMSLAAQAHLSTVQEELSAAREAAAAAAAWWSTRETKATATLRQQAKLIDFLQSKVEEAKRKKCSLSNKLFGRSGRRAAAASPPLRRVNRELREEVDRLRAKLAAKNAGGDASLPATPMKENSKPMNGKVLSIDTPDGAAASQDTKVQIVWADNQRVWATAGTRDGALALVAGGPGGRTLTARPDRLPLDYLPQNEATRALPIRIENGSVGESEAAVVFKNTEQLAEVVSSLRPARYSPRHVLRMAAEPRAALYATNTDLAIGSSEGVHSPLGPLRLVSPAGALPRAAAPQLCLAPPRVLLVHSGHLWHCSLQAFASTLRRASTLQPVVEVTKVELPDSTEPHLLRAISGVGAGGEAEWCAAVSCGRRVHVLHWSDSAGTYRVSRSLTLPGHAPNDLLLTPDALYVAAERPLRLALPSAAALPYAATAPPVHAAHRAASPPKAILLIREKPVEVLLCYAECGVFLDERGRATREQLNWNTAFNSWAFVAPFLYAFDDNEVVMMHIDEEACRAPPCTCDDHSIASTPSESYSPSCFKLKLDEPLLLGTAANGVIVRTRCADQYSVQIVEGLAAFRSIGASIESLETVDSRGSSTELARSMTDIPQENGQDDSQESVIPHTGFLADIRTRAKQLRLKNRKTADDVIKEILTTEVGLKRSSTRRMSPVSTSEFSSESEGEGGFPPPAPPPPRAVAPLSPADLCAQMFTRQVRFQH